MMPRPIVVEVVILKFTQKDQYTKLLCKNVSFFHMLYSIVRGLYHNHPAQYALLKMEH